MTELGLLTTAQLETALEAQRSSGHALGQLIVELGFASGAAVAHALAIQAGRSLRTEYGYALGVPSPGTDSAAGPDERPRARNDEATGLPKLRLVDSAYSAARRREESTSSPSADGVDGDASSDPGPLLAREERSIRDTEPLAGTSENPHGELVAAGQSPADVPEESALEGETSTQSLPGAVADGEFARVCAERDRLAAGFGELEGALASALSRVAEAERVEAALAEARLELARQAAVVEEHERRLREADDRLRVGDDRLAVFDEVEEQRGLAVAEVERLEGERGELAGRLELVQDELRATHERLGVADAEFARVCAERDRLAAGFGELEGALASALSRVAEAERVEAALAEAAALVEEHERRLAVFDEVEERRGLAVAEVERLEGERGELAGRLEQMQDELRATHERLRIAEEAALERSSAVAEVEELELRLGELERDRAVERDATDAVHARLVAELDATRSAELAMLDRVAAAELEASAQARAATDAELERTRLGSELADAQRALRKLRKRLEAATRQIAASDDARAEAERLDAVARSWHAWVSQAPTDLMEQGSVAHLHPVGSQPAPGAEHGDFMLLVPTTDGYEFVREAGTVPTAGETVELPGPDGTEIRRFRVARVGRSALPNCGPCVYLLPE